MSTWYESTQPGGDGDGWDVFTGEQRDLEAWLRENAPEGGFMQYPDQHYGPTPLARVVSDHDVTDPEIARQIIGPRIWDAIVGAGGDRS